MQLRLPTEPFTSNTIRIDSAWQPHEGEQHPMELNTQEELKAHLMATDEEFRTLASKHREYDEQLTVLETKSHLTDQEQMEEVRLKKLKLRLKDQMLSIMSRYRAQKVS